MITAVANLPTVIVTGNQSNRLLGQHGGEIDQTAPPLELAGATDPPHGDRRSGIPPPASGPDRDAARAGARWRVSDANRGTSWERCQLNSSTKASKRRCWAERRAGRGTHHGLFQRAMHAFMATVFTGLGRADALGANAQANPPLRQLAQAAGSHRGKGRAVVGAQRLRQAVFPKHPLKPRLDGIGGGVAQGPALQDEAAMWLSVRVSG